MNSKTDKIRIFSTRSVRGEIRVNIPGTNKKHDYLFSDIFTDRDGHAHVIRIHNNENRFWNDDLCTQPKKKFLEVYKMGIGGDLLIQQIPYDCITILWCTYLGKNQFTEEKNFNPCKYFNPYK